MYICCIENQKKQIMKTYITYFGKNGKTATEAKNLNKASEKLRVSKYKINISNVHISILKDYEIIK